MIGPERRIELLCEQVRAALDREGGRMFLSDLYGLDSRRRRLVREAVAVLVEDGEVRVCRRRPDRRRLVVERRR